MVKCVSYNCNSIRNNSEIVKTLLDTSDIVFLQEIMLCKSDLTLLDHFNDDFRHFVFVKDREAEGINEGRPSKGVAIFWRKNLSQYISPILIDDSVIGMILTKGNFRVMFINVYMPCDLQTGDALDNYRHALASLQILINEQSVNNVILVGDFNADPRKGRFWKELSNFSKSLSLMFLGDQLPDDVFTYLCPTKNTTSWLDHIFCTTAIAKNISNVYVEYNYALYDHFPLCFDFDFSSDIQYLRNSDIRVDEFVDWRKVNEENKAEIQEEMDKGILGTQLLDYNVLSCSDINCKDGDHLKEIDLVFSSLKNILLNSTEQFKCEHNRKFKIVPGWNDEVKHLHSKARETFLLWKVCGRPVSGDLCESMRTARAEFKCALKYCKDNEELIRKEKLLRSLNDKDYKRFWKEVNVSKKTDVVQSCCIDGIDDSNAVCNLFSDKYKQIYNKHRTVTNEQFSKAVSMSNKEKASFILKFSKNDVKRAIGMLKHNIGVDNIHSNHLKMCSETCVELISMMFISFVMHGYIPIAMLRGVITPIVKNKFGDLSSADNYRPVMASSVFLKLFEYCVLDIIKPYIQLNERQHGFRANYSTSSACLVLKETVFSYINSNSDVYACFLDISKAFDSVDHEILMKKLLDYGIPRIYVDLIRYWYGNQWVKVRFMSQFSDEWKIENGVRQGGVLSGLLFSAYIDSMLEKIAKLKIGCRLGLISSNIIAYADDIVLLAPSARGLQILINEAHNEALKLDLNFNIAKTKCMIYRSKPSSCKSWKVVPFSLAERPIEVVESFKYLGYVISSTLNNTDDVHRAMTKFYGEFNSILRKFHFADVKVKVFLFKQFCLQFYGPELWFFNKGASYTLKQFAVGYHKAIKKILGLSYHESNHFACQEAQLLTFWHLVNKIKILYSFKLLTQPCDFIKKIREYVSLSFVSVKEVFSILKEQYQIDFLLDNDRDAILSRIQYVQNHEEQMRVSW